MRKLFFVPLIFLVSVSHAGGIGSGGGAGIFCPESVTRQPRVQLLDFVQGRYGDEALVIPESQTPTDMQIDVAIARLSFDPFLQQDLRGALTTIRQNARFLPPGISINAPSDLGVSEAVLVPTGCMIGAIGFYESTGVLKISSDAFTALSPTQQAAFYLHEAFYLLVRQFRQKTGLTEPLTAASTRLLVARLFAPSVTSEQLADASAPATWSSVLKIDDFRWTAATGAEAWFSSRRARYTPLHLPAKGGQIELEIRSTGPLTPSVCSVSGCGKPFVGCAEDVSRFYPVGFTVGQTVQTIAGDDTVSRATMTLPQDCRILVFTSGVMSWENRDPKTVSVFYQGELLLRGRTNGPFGFDMWFPLY